MQDAVRERSARRGAQRRALPRGLRRRPGGAGRHRHLADDRRLLRSRRWGRSRSRPGTTLGEVYRKLFLGWGVTLPAGVCPNVGVGGHVLGGGFGFLCRQHGLAADHLYGVEVVVVDETGTARSVIATREPSDPNRELWWAHTGGGGGNFGIVTRYWFRSPDASGADPARLLPKAPASVLIFQRGLELGRHRPGGLRQAGPQLRRLVRAQQRGGLSARPVCTAPSSSIAASTAPSRSAGCRPPERTPSGCWTSTWPPSTTASVRRAHVRSRPAPGWASPSIPSPACSGPSPGASLQRQGRAPPQALHGSPDRRRLRALTRTDHDVPGWHAGGWPPTAEGSTRVAPDATASAQRDSILTTPAASAGEDPRDEARSLAWVRTFYRDLFADTGGVPVPGDVSERRHDQPSRRRPGRPGVEHLRRALAHAVLQGQAIPGCSSVKARWDPRNVFRHALSIRLPDQA